MPSIKGLLDNVLLDIWKKVYCQSQSDKFVFSEEETGHFATCCAFMALAYVLYCSECEHGSLAFGGGWGFCETNRNSDDM